MFVHLLGYLLAFTPVLLLVVGQVLKMPWLAFVFFFIVLPAVRPCLPDAGGSPVVLAQQSSTARRFLEAIPAALATFWLALLPWTMFVVRDLSGLPLLCFGLSFWVVTSVNLTVAHELLHRRGTLHRWLGRVLAACGGHFHLVEEHWVHHARAGGAHDRDVPRIDESVFAYAARRYLASFSLALDWERSAMAPTRARRRLGMIATSVLVTATTAITFYLIAGLDGINFYLLTALGTSFTLQAITYVQHWGLNDELGAAPSRIGYSWEDRCPVQAWVTLNHAFHGHHHLQPSLAFHQLHALPRSPKLPASYPVMLTIALLPPVYKRLMEPRLLDWLSSRGMDAPPVARRCGDPVSTDARGPEHSVRRRVVVGHGSMTGTAGATGSDSQPVLTSLDGCSATNVHLARPAAVMEVYGDEQVRSQRCHSRGT